MRARTLIGWSLTALVSAALFDACGGDVATAPTQSAPAAPVGSGPSETEGSGGMTMASAIPSSATYGAATVVSGTESCQAKEGTETVGPDGARRARGWLLTCTHSASDARVSGTARYTWNYDLWGSGRSFAHVQWGTGRIENEDGAWEATYSGSFTPMTGDLILFWFTGSGAYKGLAYGMWAIVPPSEAGLTYPVRGIIFPGSPPPR